MIMKWVNMVMGSGMSIDLFVHLLVGSGYGTKKL